MHRTFCKVLLSYVVTVMVMFIGFGSVISNAQSSNFVQNESAGWLADFIISGVNLFLKLILAIT